MVSGHDIRDAGGADPDRVVAFFDMDYTILRESSGRLYLRYLRESGSLTWSQWAWIAGQVMLYTAGAIDFPRLMGRLVVRVAGASEAEAWRLSQAWFRDMLRAYISDDARRRIEWHRVAGHAVAIASAATPYAVAPVARELGLGDGYLATELEVVAGRFTGAVQEPACYGAGKLARAQAYAAGHGLDLRESYFYTDSHHDLPLLEAVGHPVAVNPSRHLARTAGARGWTILRFA